MAAVADRSIALSKLLLAALFGLVALLYAMVGFGGGSSYNALLILAKVDYQQIPIIALICNIVVVTGGVFHFHRAGHLRWRAILPFAVSSVPLAAIGGSLPIAEGQFVLLLGLALLVSGVAMLWPQRPLWQISVRTRWLIGLPFGAGLGLLAGIVGIGGGIFLAPLMHTLNWERPKVIAAGSSGFILVNSLAGLFGQASKMATSRIDVTMADLLAYSALPIAVLLGGQTGSWLGAGVINERSVRLLTALLVLYVAVRLLLRAAAY